jgi:tRNA(adenine34) deaminase
MMACWSPTKSPAGCFADRTQEVVGAIGRFTYIAPMTPERYDDYMHMALQEALLAYEEQEVPVGAVVVFDGRVIGRGHNQTVQLKDASAHAEMIALSAAYNYFDDWRLQECTLVCTLEPCPMCAGAAMLSRIQRIVYGAPDPKFGACGSIVDIPAETRFNHQIEVIPGILGEQVAALMRQFFQEVRTRKQEPS